MIGAWFRLTHLRRYQSSAKGKGATDPCGPAGGFIVTRTHRGKTQGYSRQIRKLEHASRFDCRFRVKCRMRINSLELMGRWPVVLVDPVGPSPPIAVINCQGQHYRTPHIVMQVVFCNPTSDSRKALTYSEIKKHTFRPKWRPGHSNFAGYSWVYCALLWPRVTLENVISINVYAGQMHLSNCYSKTTRISTNVYGGKVE